jgi:hypothetical protein
VRSFALGQAQEPGIEEAAWEEEAAVDAHERQAPLGHEGVELALAEAEMVGRLAQGQDIGRHGAASGCIVC